MIVVTGATGQLGRRVVEGLLERVPSDRIGISVRNPEKAEDFRKRGARVCQGDFAEPAKLAEAFDGAEQILIISANSLGDEGLRYHRNAIEEAKRAGAKRILYTSHQAASATSLFAPTRDNHAPTEALLEKCGVAFVSLRNGFYAESALFQLGGLKQTGKITLPADGPVSWTARADLADAAVAALTELNLFDGVTPPLTNSKMLDFAGIAALASEILGRNVPRETISDDAYQNALRAQGFSGTMASLLLTLYEAARAREFAVVDPTLERVLKRKPTTMKEILTRFLSTSENKLF